MKNIIDLTLLDFKNTYKGKVEYKVTDDTTDYCEINGIQYLIVWYCVLRKPNAKILRKRYLGQKIIIISKSICDTAKEYLQKHEINYLENDGSFYYREGNVGLDKIKNNGYEKRLNPSRIHGYNGSKLRLAIISDPTLLSLSPKDIALKINMKVSTVYHLMKQMKDSDYFEYGEDPKEIKIKLEHFDKNEILKNLFIRGFNKIVKEPVNFKPFSNISSLQNKIASKIECEFYEDLEDCRDVSTRVKNELDKGKLVIFTPYYAETSPEVYYFFKREIRNWYVNADFEKISA